MPSLPPGFAGGGEGGGLTLAGAERSVLRQQSLTPRPALPPQGRGEGKKGSDLVQDSRLRGNPVYRALVIAVAISAILGCHRDKVPTQKYFSGEPVSHWVADLKSPDARVRKHAVDVLGNVGPSDPAVIPALAGMVEDKEPSVRLAAVYALSKNGSAAAEAAPALRKASQDSDPAVRAAATKALEQIGGRT